MPATKTIRREFLQLAKTYDPKKNKIAGFYLSEKEDGGRSFWDGGISRGVPTDKVPWAGIVDPKTGERKKKIAPTATGLWSRYGNVIHAPDWYLNLLPCMFLDGELTAGRGKFQTTMSIIRGDEPDPRFDQIKYAIYGNPSIMSVFGNGEIKNTNFHRNINLEECANFIEEQRRTSPFCRELQVSMEPVTFEEELLTLARALELPVDSVEHESRVYLHRQIKLSTDETEAKLQVDQHMDRIIGQGGEGVIIRDPRANWTPKRVSALLKYKPFHDDEGTITGFTSGRETDKGSKLRGKMGALILDYNGKRLEIAGLTDEEREFGDVQAHGYAFVHPGEEMPAQYKAKHFMRGQKVTFLYRELSDDGIPKDARYFRPRDEE